MQNVLFYGQHPRRRGKHRFKGVFFNFQLEASFEGVFFNFKFKAFFEFKASCCKKSRFCSWLQVGAGEAVPRLQQCGPPNIFSIFPNIIPLIPNIFSIFSKYFPNLSKYFFNNSKYFLNNSKYCFQYFQIFPFFLL